MANQSLLSPAFTEPAPRAQDAVRKPLPVLKPRLPAAALILPYIESIDEACWYSNYGPLVNLLEERLSHHLHQEDAVVTVANATLGLTACLLARNIPAGSFCLMPSWTFAATPHAARTAGLTPWFHDVDATTWALQPDAVLETVQRISAPVGAVIVVSPFGAPLDVEAWLRFEDKTGIYVVFDQAAGFDTVRASSIPSVVSLHATKILGAGEGGFIVTTDAELRARLRACCNFGFLESRTAAIPALNAKMSEYHAAVALAGLELWATTREQHARIADWYCTAIQKIPGVTLQPGYGQGWVSATTSLVLPPETGAALIARSLGRSDIDTRQWWGQGCHVQAAFARDPRGPLPVTEQLGAAVIGLPHYPDMSQPEVERVAWTLADALYCDALNNMAERIAASRHY